jgi:hypothetical protein
VTAMVVLVVGVHHHHLVAEEPGGLRPPVGDQGLGRGQLQLELLAQEPPGLVLDLLGLLPGPVKPSTQSSAYADSEVMPSMRTSSLVVR